MSTKTLQLSPAFEFVSQLWLSEVDLKMLCDLNEPGVCAAVEGLGGFVPAEVDSTTGEVLAIDYCQLLIDPHHHISPIQSIWEDQRFQGDAAVHESSL